MLEVANVDGEFCGRLLAGAGADVIKVEPPSGQDTRHLGPFLDDLPKTNTSLYFWQYNLGKRGITLDLDRDEGRRLFTRLVATADILLESMPPGWMRQRGLDYDALANDYPELVLCSISPFGQWGPWRDYRSSDLIQLALGGQMMVCGYDPEGDYDPAHPEPNYDTPPIAPQMWHSSHIAGAQAAIAIVGALYEREVSGIGDYIDVSMHEALAGCTELAVPYWIYNRTPVHRQTGRHAFPTIAQPFIHPAADGRWIQAMPSIGFADSWGRFVDLLRSLDAVQDLDDPKYADVRYRSAAEPATHITEVLQAAVLQHEDVEELMHAAQAAGLPWAVVRRPEDNVGDPHWESRDAFTRIAHPELNGREFTYLGAPWLSNDVPWSKGARAPLLGEDNDDIYREIGVNDEELARLRQIQVI